MSRVRRPDPPPLPTNDVKVAAGGTAAWGVALVVLLLVDLPADERWWLWVCVAGMAIGLFAVWYVPRLQSAREREETERANRRAAALENRAPVPSPVEETPERAPKQP